MHSPRMHSSCHVGQAVCAGKANKPVWRLESQRSEKAGVEIGIMSDHEGESRRAELRGDPPPFTLEQLAWLEEYRPPTSVTGAVMPGSALSVPPGPSSDGSRPRLVTAASVPGKCYTLLVSFQFVACSGTVLVARVGGGEVVRTLAPPPLLEETVVVTTQRAWLARLLLPSL